jgi:hypothetical protein
MKFWLSWKLRSAVYFVSSAWVRIGVLATRSGKFKATTFMVSKSKSLPPATIERRFTWSMDLTHEV